MTKQKLYRLYVLLIYSVIY